MSEAQQGSEKNPLPRSPPALLVKGDADRCLGCGDSLVRDWDITRFWSFSAARATGQHTWRYDPHRERGVETESTRRTARSLARTAGGNIVAAAL